MTDKYEGHTEGPWTCTDEPDDFRDYSILGPSGLAVAVAVQNGFVPPEETKANAKLLTAGPDLLAENKRLREALEMVEAYTAEPLNAATKKRENHIHNTVTQALQETE